MADRIIKIITPADSFDLLTKEEVKLALSIADSDTSHDALIDQLIDSYSDMVSELCNRVFAKEKLSETWRYLQSNRVFLSHWPVKTADIESVESPRGTIIPTTDWELEEGSGKLSLWGSRAEPIVVTYTGGFVLPDDAPDALKQACVLLVQYDRSQAQRQATSGIRSISHKSARVMFFDPNQGSRGGGGGPGSTAADAVHNLLMHYTRLEV